MTKDKFITDELIEAKMIEKGYGEKSSHDEEHVRKLILDHYEVELTDRWNQNCDFYIYEESTADGYYWITGRVDDVINVSGHRLGTAEIESALVSINL